MSGDGIAESKAEAVEAVQNVSPDTALKCDGTSNSDSVSRSALEDNIAQKGKNAYYFAHAHKANGPEWDGKAEPRLLSSRSLSAEEHKVKISSFEYHKSNITSYAFADEDTSVKLYVSLDGVGDRCSDEDISLHFTNDSFSLQVRNYEDETRCLSFGKLTAKISDASYKKKKNRIIVTLTKEKAGVWHTINDKGAPDHELV